MIFLIVYIALGFVFILNGGITQYQVPSGVIKKERGTIAGIFLWPLLLIIDQSVLLPLVHKKMYNYQSQSNWSIIYQGMNENDPFTFQGRSLFEVCNKIHEFIYTRHGIQTLDWRLNLEVELNDKNKLGQRIIPFVVQESGQKEIIFFVHLPAQVPLVGN